jgi:hypothetical protein
MPLEFQLGLISNCLEVVASVLWECSAQNDRNIEWIEAAP